MNATKARTITNKATTDRQTRAKNAADALLPCVIAAIKAAASSGQDFISLSGAICDSSIPKEVGDTLEAHGYEVVYQGDLQTDCLIRWNSPDTPPF